jgi:nucleotide-binding universal stress UspA family protein
MIADNAERGSLATHPALPAERRGAHGGAFSSVICAVDRTTSDQAARRQAELLASPDGTVDVVSTSWLARPGQRALHEKFEGHDLLALGAGPAAYTAVQRTRIPILIARPCPLGTQVTDTILVPVDATPESNCAVELAARLATVHSGTVTIVAAPPRDPALQRAIATSERILLRATGATPRVLGEPLPREHSVPVAASLRSASLVVLGFGPTEIERNLAARMIGSFGCSVLAVPALDRIGMSVLAGNARAPGHACVA